MDQEHVGGAADEAKGATRDAADILMDDKKLQAGKIDKAEAAAHEAGCDAKDATVETERQAASVDLACVALSR
ncbi:MAG: CsbD family protein [Roseiarcus sp.]